MRTTHSRLLAIVAGCALAVSATLPAAAQGPDDARRAEHERVVKFWTKERVAKAVPRHYVLDPKTKEVKPAAKPTKPPSASTTVLGASWTTDVAVKRTTGKVLFAMGTSYYVCSASVVDDDNTAGRSLILTAGHCVVDETTGDFATNWMFIPDYDSAPATLTTNGSFCADTRYGCWVADYLVASEAFASAGGFTDTAILHDYAFAVVSKGGTSGTAQLDATVGAQQITFDQKSNGLDTFLFGYPAAGKYKGKDLIYSRGLLGTDPNTGGATYRVSSNQTGGSSGGPWFAEFGAATTGQGILFSVNSYGYTGVTAMHGPKFTDETAGMFNAAKTAEENIPYGG